MSYTVMINNGFIPMTQCEGGKKSHCDFSNNFFLSAKDVILVKMQLFFPRDFGIILHKCQLFSASYDFFLLTL